MKQRIIAVINQKGGVGKTTSTLNIGAALADKNYKTLLIDLDPQGNLSNYLDCDFDDKRPRVDVLLNAVITNQIIPDNIIRTSSIKNLDYIPADINLSFAERFLQQAVCRETVLKRALNNSMFADYDYIIIDCLPSLGLLAMNAVAAATDLFIPVQAHKFALDGMNTLLSVVNEIRAPLNPTLNIIGILPTMVDNTNMSASVVDALVNRYNGTVFNTHISRSITAANSTYEHTPISSRLKLGAQYVAVAEEIIERTKSEV